MIENRKMNTFNPNHYVRQTRIKLRNAFGPMKHFLLLFLFSFFCSLAAEAQFGQGGTKRNYKKSKQARKYSKNFKRSTKATSRVGQNKSFQAISAYIGPAFYYGDIAPNNAILSTDYQWNNLSVGGKYHYQLHRFFSVYGGYSFVHLRASDYLSTESRVGDGDAQALSRYQRNLDFRNNIHEFSVGGLFYPLSTTLGKNYRPNINPYFTLGFAMLLHSPKGWDPELDDWVALRPLETEGVSYSSVTAAIPIGIGLTTSLSFNFDIGFEINYRYVFSDYLDDVSDSYPELSSFNDYQAARMSNKTGLIEATNGNRRDPALLKQLESEGVPEDWDDYQYSVGSFGGGQRGNPSQNDGYMLFAIKGVYFF